MLGAFAFGLGGTLLLGAFRLGAFPFGTLLFGPFGACGSLLFGALPFGPFGPLGLCDLLLLGALAFGLRSAVSLRGAAIPPPQGAILLKGVTWLYGVVLLRGVVSLWPVVLLCSWSCCALVELTGELAIVPEAVTRGRKGSVSNSASSSEKRPGDAVGSFRHRTPFDAFGAPAAPGSRLGKDAGASGGAS